ncbi:hypothetical protein J7E25_03720 [Agromyces sp. ISL-38]|uniref:carbohydrate binding domain-containing protein n=1 Tax=Agromyces sp. ISL-38 TaxID=2819107 RepID=UPI001BE79182|nr:carbohydrate binding domain-containing protein [Agromyces sp. ISL-38]MBT2498193.1 hypothetical protein [Agromyces sp. ISL-38]MBT2518657.1 hypothetical protein [Streptomyces sp. ISL-90]
MPFSIGRFSRRRRILVAVASIVALLAGGGTLALVASQPASARTSSTFESWGSWTEGGADVGFLADTTVRRSGAASLRITDASPLKAGVYGAISQGVSVKPNTRYDFTVWVRASGARTKAGSIFYAGRPDDRKYLPAGTYGWRKLSWSYTTGASESVLPIAVQAQDLGQFWFDDFTITTRGQSASVLANGGFEAFESLIGLGVSDLFFAPGDARIPITSPTPSVAWEVRDAAGVLVKAGTADTSTGAATLDFAALGPGYYRLVLSGAGAARSTSFTIVDGLDEALGASASRFGTTMHPTLQPGVHEDAAAAGLGLGAARLDLRWEAIELSPGVYTWDAATDDEVARLQARGVRPTLVIAYYGPYDAGRTPSSPDGIAGYTDFLRAAAERYGDGVDYQIYNEFNIAYSNGLCGQTPACYLKLLQPASQAVHEVAPGARVVGPALAGNTAMWLTSNESYNWLAEFFALGGLDLVDVVSVHNYGAPAAPEGHNDAVIRKITGLMAGYPAAANTPLWLGETGYFTTGEAAGGVSELQQARYLVRDASLALAEGVDAYLVYDLLDDWNDPQNPEANFGLVRNPASQSGVLAPKPVFTTMAVLTRQLEDRVFDRRDPVPQGAYSLVFTDASGSALRVMWATASTTVTAKATGAVTVVDQFGRSSRIDPVSGRVSIRLGVDPIYVTGGGIVF